MSNQMNFVNYDFDDLVLQLTNRLREQGAWKDTYRSSTGAMIIELFAYIANKVLYYVERRAEESYLFTAKNKSSIINLVRLLNYKPKRKISSVGNLRFTLTGGVHTKTVFIPKYTKCSDVSGTKFLVSSDVAIMPGQTFVDSPGIQGELKTIRYNSTGAVSQEFNIKNTAVENTNIEVLVGNEMWSAVDSFIDSTTISKHYIVKTELNDTITIVFGDGVFGIIPPIDKTIEVRYIESLGLNGNVYELNRITGLDSVIYDTDDVIMTVAVTNITTFLGGDDEETADEIRNEAPKVFSTGDRAVRRADFIAILNNYPGIADSNAWGENEENPPNYNMFNQVNMCLILQNWILPDSRFKNTLSEYLYTKSLLTVRYSYVDPIILHVIPTFSEVKVNRGYTLSSISSAIDTVMEGQFELGNTTKLETPKRISDLIDIIEEINGVSYHYMELRIRQVLTIVGGSWTGVLNALPILPRSVDVYVNNEKVAVDNGSGGITDMSPVYTITGNINYVNGSISINFTPAVPTGAIVSVQYKQNQNGDIVPLKNQICKLHDVNIQNISYVT